MSLFDSPPTTTKTSFQRGDYHLGVWALQSFLNDIYEGKLEHLAEDGAFGVGTEFVVRKYQADVQAVSDGVVGPQTQGRMVRSCVVRTGVVLPKGLLEGQIEVESGGYFAAANSKVVGGIDLGLTQRRCYGPPFDPTKVKEAINPIPTVTVSAVELNTWAIRYGVNRHPDCPFNRWQLAVLHHNWPWAAETYWKNGKLPSPGLIASWVTWTRMTYDQWAHYYVSSVTEGVVW